MSALLWAVEQNRGDTSCPQSSSFSHETGRWSRPAGGKWSSSRCQQVTRAPGLPDPGVASWSRAGQTETWKWGRHQPSGDDQKWYSQLRKNSVCSSGGAGVSLTRVSELEYIVWSFSCSVKRESNGEWKQAGLDSCVWPCLNSDTVTFRNVRKWTKRS